MLRLLAYIYYLAAVLTVLSTKVAQLPTIYRHENAIPGRHIVKLRDGVAKAPVLGALNMTVEALLYDWTIINGFAGEFNAMQLDILQLNPDVEFIEEDATSHIAWEMSPTAPNSSSTKILEEEPTVNATRYTIEPFAPWGISRLSVPTRFAPGRNPLVSDFPYYYYDDNLHGVDIYVVDTGVYVEHTEFQGRARWGPTYNGTLNRDMTGHGTHVAATAAGSQYGVCKSANIIAVKVTDDTGSASNIDCVSGLDWVLKNAKITKRASVVNYSLGTPQGSPSPSIDKAVKSLTQFGVHVVAAAGNDNTPASGSSPAREPSVITVGGSNISDSRRWSSNYGPSVNIFAPGENIMSAGIANRWAVVAMNGTSMATPHVSGLIAYIITTEANQSPANMATTITRMALQNVLTNLPPGTPNRLANNDAFRRVSIPDSKGQVVLGL